MSEPSPPSPPSPSPPPAKAVELLALSGSLRKGSFNTALLRAVAKLAPAGASVVLEDGRDLPLYDGDLDVDGGPPAVKRLKERLAAATAVVLATPEYNYGMSGVLKNALDWTSRPGFASLWVGKPVLVLGASAGVVGTARAQAQVKTTLLAMLAHPFPTPELLVGEASKKLDLEGNVTDEKLKAHLEKALAGLVRFAARLGDGA